MHARTSHPRLCRNDGLEAARAAVLADFDRHLDDLRRCVHWLIAAGIAVLEADMRRGLDLPKVTVAGSPYLHALLKDDCANIGRRQEGALTYTRWIGVRHGVVIHWEEVCA